MSESVGFDVETALLERIAAGSGAPGDLRALKALGVQVRGDRNHLQVGKYHVTVEQGGNVHIGDRVYRGDAADALREALEQVVQPGLRGLSGALVTIGMIVCVVGLGIFFMQGLFADTPFPPAPGESFGPPPGVARGLTVFFAGFVIAFAGTLLRAWKK